MIAAVPAVVSLAAEAASGLGESGPPAWALGLTTLGIFLVLLFAVTRFNRDR